MIMQDVCGTLLCLVVLGILWLTLALCKAAGRADNQMARLIEQMPKN